MSGILLHPTKGVNPYLTYCPRCGGDGRDLILVGRKDSVNECRACKLTVFGGGPCPKCGMSTEFVRKMEDREKLPGGLCEACEKEEAEHEAAVAEGGVYFKCADCGVRGVIKASAPFAAKVREAHGIAAPKPCGVEFTKKDGCPQCGDKA